MSVAVCDPEAFYPLRNLVSGPFTDLRQLIEVERFVRAVVLHDEISMELEPCPSDPDSEQDYAEEEEWDGGHNVIVAVGPILSGYDFFTKQEDGRKQETLDISLSPALIAAAREFSKAEAGNVYYRAHVEYLKHIVSVVQRGGSALLAGNFGNAAITISAQYPEKLFETIDRDWDQLAREADAGAVGFIVPPVLSIVLTRCAKRDAIPAVLKDLRDEWASARVKVWDLFGRLKTARTVFEMREVQHELTAASRLLSPIQPKSDIQPVRVLWDLIVGGVVGIATTALMSGGPPNVGAAMGAAMGAASRSIPALLHELGPVLFGRGAFDLAKRIRQETMCVEYDALARLLTDPERQQLGI